MRLAALGGLAAGASALTLAPGPALALEDSAPDLGLHSALAYRGVVEAGDLLVLSRYSLPESDWLSYGSGGALVRLLLADEVQQERAPARLGEAITGFYLAAGHGVPVGSDDLTVSLISNPALFEQNSAASEDVQEVNPADLPRSLCESFKNLLLAVEAADTEDAHTTGALVLAGAVTQGGTVMARDAFALALQVLPDCFFVGVEQPEAAFDPNTPALRDELQEDFAEGPLFERLHALFTAWGFESITAPMALVFGGLAVAAIAVKKSAATAMGRVS